MINHVIWSSMVDFPNNISSVLFTGLCNWNCEYCYNKDMLNKECLDNNTILNKLFKRQDFIKHIIISGGECCIYGNKLIDFVEKLNKYGFVVGIHTNGCFPETLIKILPLINYVGMDIKTSLNNYDNIFYDKNIKHNILQSINYIVESNVNYEFRTTLYPKYVSINDCINISNMLKNNNVNNLILQQYREINNVKPYSKEKVINIKNECSKIINVEVRNL